MAWDQLSLQVWHEFEALRLEQVDLRDAAEAALTIRKIVSRRKKQRRVRGLKRWGDGPLRFDNRTSCTCRGKGKKCAACRREFVRSKKLYDAARWRAKKSKLAA